MHRCSGCGSGLNGVEVRWSIAVLLKNKTTDSLVEINDIAQLVNPVAERVKAQNQAGEEEQNPEMFAKADLVFPSGEALPRCWIDADYRLSVG
ncbi:gsl0042 [Gloeobacter violaceus PCC 7421]|uniref:Gsl0042 protein n=1 Tax=Gloeobacter violaceus (strain ATCC 29082 / PCC 7421) TaxID=251221 RepID=Q7NPL3_GLOVI|nr:gsl0042 [Gloeobacter violaceus PCC 7421]